MSDAYTPFEIDINLEEVKEWNGERRPLLPEGTYKMEIADVSNEGKYVKVEFKVVDGEHIDGRAWNNYMTNNKVGMGRLKQLMIACGASLSRFNSDELIGQTIYADVVHSVGKPQVNEMGEPKEPTTFANVQNERSVNSVESEQGDGAPSGEDPPAPPITRSQPPTTQAAPTTQDTSTQDPGPTQPAPKNRARRA